MRGLILDTLGGLMAATRTEIAPLAHALAALFGRGEEASVAGAPGRSSLLGAAYANGRLANAMDFDETFPVGVHFGVGAVAAAGATAKALGFDAKLTAEAIGLAGSNAPLPVGHKWAVAVDLPNCKYCDSGWCTLAGVFAALSAGLGSTGFTDILDGDNGLLRMCGVARGKPALMLKDVGRRWMLEDLTYRPWPSCRWTHYPLTVLDRLLTAHRLTADDVEAVLVLTSPLANSRRFTHPAPTTFAGRQFSYPHLVAMMLLGVPGGPDWLDARIAGDPRVAAMRAKVRVELHPLGDNFAKTLERGQMRTMPGGVRVRTKDGTLAADTDYALGDPWDAATRWGDAEVRAKFHRLTARPDAEKIAGDIFAIETLPSLAPVVGLFAATARERGLVRSRGDVRP